MSSCGTCSKPADPPEEPEGDSRDYAVGDDIRDLRHRGYRVEQVNPDGSYTARFLDIDGTPNTFLPVVVVDREQVLPKPPRSIRYARPRMPENGDAHA